MCIGVRLVITCFFRPAGVPSGMCGGPGNPIGVPDIGMPYCGALTPAIMPGNAGGAVLQWPFPHPQPSVMAGANGAGKPAIGKPLTTG